jgi:molecular chaperone IbpA
MDFIFNLLIKEKKMVTFNLDNITRQAIGFDNLFNSMLNNNVGDTGYPPYNLIKDKEDTYLLQFALAGFKEKELDVQVKENKLTIKGESSDKEDDLEYLHRGIGKRVFERQFVLADTLHVEGCTFFHGILEIKLKQIIPEEKKPRKIQIK